MNFCISSALGSSAMPFKRMCIRTSSSGVNLQNIAIPPCGRRFRPRGLCRPLQELGKTAAFALRRAGQRCGSRGSRHRTMSASPQPTSDPDTTAPFGTRQYPAAPAALAVQSDASSGFFVSEQPEIIVRVQKSEIKFFRQASSQRGRLGAKGTVNMDK